MSEAIEKARARGLKEGRTDALLEEHTARLDRINGSIDRHALAMEKLTAVVHDGYEKLDDAIRTMQEEARAAVLAVEVSRATLAKETERRRVALADEGATVDRKFSKRQRLAMLAVALAAVLVTVYFGLQG